MKFNKSHLILLSVFALLICSLPLEARSRVSFNFFANFNSRPVCRPIYRPAPVVYTVPVCPAPVVAVPAPTVYYTPTTTCTPGIVVYDGVRYFPNPVRYVW
jgi:hypothetical protein